jgi:hypothetical protein
MSGPVVTGGWVDLSWAVLTAMQTAEHPGCGSLSTGDEAAPEGSFLNNHTYKHVNPPLRTGVSCFTPTTYGLISHIVYQHTLTQGPLTFSLLALQREKKLFQTNVVG